ncbi:hypothetical protein ACFPYI_06535 [Halomarina salina]|uniref:Uncharacterized protein n=1 Tax=Halomarina salina TaxID=1872699 RepID=A0ABD5RK62_9EURY|nr:hypothetical protein [Halomarina salina]
MPDTGHPATRRPSAARTTVRTVDGTESARYEGVADSASSLARRAAKSVTPSE